MRNVRMILQAVGVVRGMEPDINPNWVSGANRHSMATAWFRLLPDERVVPEHNLRPSSRDRYTFYARA